MDIKERFYANLNMIREEKDVVDHKAPGVKKLKDGTYWAKSQSGTMKIFNSEKAAIAHSKKKAVTGMDEESEQLDEIVGSMLAGAALGLGAGTAISNAMSGNPIGKKIKKVVSKLKKNRANSMWYKKWSSAAKSSRKMAVTGMDEEAEQLDELDRDGILKRYSNKVASKVATGEKKPDYRIKGAALAGRKRWGGTGGIPSAKVPATTKKKK